MRFVDAHIHLSDPAYSGKVDQIIKEAKRANVVAVVSNGMNLETSALSARLGQEYPNFVFAALGIHPWNVSTMAPDELNRTINLISKYGADRESVVAVGEVGLDPQYAKRKENKELQLKVFHEMRSATEKSSLPIIVHSRWSAQKIMAILPSYHLRGVLFHWFSSPVELLPVTVERGYYISEGPPTVFSSRIQDVVKRVPLTNLLTETDGPVQYYAHPFKDKLTTPSFIPQVIKAVAEIKGMKEEEVANQTIKNFVNFFGTAELNPKV